MALRIDELRASALRYFSAGALPLNEERVRTGRTAFLCHSHHDQDLVKGLIVKLVDSGWDVYVDWIDTTMPQTPNRETARRIQKKICEMNYFLFLATANSMSSRWCPWEIGYADGKKALDQIVVIPTRDGTTTHGSEYLDLYRRLDVSDAGNLAVWQPGDHDHGTRVRNL